MQGRPNLKVSRKINKEASKKLNKNNLIKEASRKLNKNNFEFYSTSLFR